MTYPKEQIMLRLKPRTYGVYSVIFVLIYFLALVLRIFFSFSFVLVFIIFSFSL